ncbi:MAG TPA: hypothetical protein VD788_08690, partial [Candidatus Polarisedimenticolaceae bacterium]|nr:hypothetical protein [Candidatus Polarisedimenticolaceae bacterium]
SHLIGCHFHNSVLAGGAKLSDCTIEQSVVGIRTVMNRATVKRALIMGAEDDPPRPNLVGVRDGALIQDAIVDLNACIGRGAKIVNEERLQEASGDGWVIREGIVVVLKNAVIADGTVI